MQDISISYFWLLPHHNFTECPDFSHSRWSCRRNRKNKCVKNENFNFTAKILIENLSIGKTWNACVFVIESPRGRSAKRPRRYPPPPPPPPPTGFQSRRRTHSTSYLYLFNSREMSVSSVTVVILARAPP